MANALCCIMSACPFANSHFVASCFLFPLIQCSCMLVGGNGRNRKQPTRVLEPDNIFHFLGHDPDTNLHPLVLYEGFLLVSNFAWLRGVLLQCRKKGRAMPSQRKGCPNVCFQLEPLEPTFERMACDGCRKRFAWLLCSGCNIECSFFALRTNQMSLPRGEFVSHGFVLVFTLPPTIASLIPLNVSFCY